VALRKGLIGASFKAPTYINKPMRLPSAHTSGGLWQPQPCRYQVWNRPGGPWPNGSARSLIRFLSAHRSSPWPSGNGGEDGAAIECHSAERTNATGNFVPPTRYSFAGPYRGASSSSPQWHGRRGADDRARQRQRPAGGLLCPSWCGLEARAERPSSWPERDVDWQMARRSRH